MTIRDRFLENLPKSDENREIQTNSFDALNSFLPKNRLCLRDERIEDYGVDASLEILNDGTATNFRAQIQLKGTRSLEPNEDGSYSLQVDTSNLNYLLNNPISIYILYIEPKDEFRFVWARNEFQRFEEKNPEWIKQETITLRFNEILDSEKLEEIIDQIIKQSSLNRELNETLVLAQSNVLVEINPDTFEITDRKAILTLITNFGINLVNEGYGREVLEKINLLDSSDREKSSVLVVKVYAEYCSGHYRIAKDLISLLTISGQDLTEEDTLLVNWLEVTCDYRLGNINSKELIERLEAISKKDNAENFSAFRFNYIHTLLLGEENLIRRNELLNQLRDELKKISSDGTSDENVLLFNYHILEAELGTIIAEFTKDMSNISIRRHLNVYRDISDLTKDVTQLIITNRERAFQWTKELYKIRDNTKNPILKADICLVEVLYLIGTLSIIQAHSKKNGVTFNEIPDDIFERSKINLEESIKIYLSLGLYERKLRAESYLAELMNLKGLAKEAEKMLSNVSNTSSKMSYAQVKANSEMPFSKMFDKLVDATNSIDFDEKWANSSDEEMEAFAQDLLENLRLPQDRFSNIKKDVIANREINKEKLYWCEHIELHQSLKHTESPDTYYAIDPDRFGHCLLYGYNSTLGNPNYEAVILAFKKTYCESCPNRKPKKN